VQWHSLLADPYLPCLLLNAVTVKTHASVIKIALHLGPTAWCEQLREVN